jgi:hypothetical protein
MTLNPFAEARRQRKYDLVAYIANPNPQVNKNGWIEVRRLVGSFSITWGLSERVIYQYVGELVDAGLIKFNQKAVKIAVNDDVLDEMFGSRETWKTTKETHQK